MVLSCLLKTVRLRFYESIYQSPSPAISASKARWQLCFRGLSASIHFPFFEPRNKSCHAPLNPNSLYINAFICLPNDVSLSTQLASDNPVAPSPSFSVGSDTNGNFACCYCNDQCGAPCDIDGTDPCCSFSCPFLAANETISTCKSNMMKIGHSPLSLP